MMLDLPTALAPWRATLSVLPDDLQRSFGPWLGRLARTIGPLHRHRHTDEGPPDGFAGLSRRGPYERLIMTEWALADAMPEEFIRRAAAKEHLFLELARQEPAGGLLSVVLFDAGPSQLGGPRLVHLAALVIFAQRALDAGAELRFGVLQRPPHPETQFSLRAAEGVMHARSGRPPTRDDWQGWLTAAAANGPPEIDDLWVVGGPQTRAWADEVGGGHLSPSDVLEPDRQAVQVDLRHGASTRRVALDLPPPSACVRALRDPYETVAPTVDPASSLVALGMRFSWDARHLMVRTRAGITALRVSRHPGEGGGTARHLEIREGTPVAADSHKRRYFVLSLCGDRLEVLVFNRRGYLDTRAWVDTPEAFVRPGADHALGPLIPLRLRGPYPREFVVLDALDTAFVLRIKDRPTLEATSAQTLDVARRGDGVVALASAADTQEHVRLISFNAQGHARPIRRFDAYPPAQAYLGPDRHSGLIAVRLGFDQWTFANRGDVVVAHPAHAVGATMHPFRTYGYLPAIVTIPDERRSVLLLGPGSLADEHPLPFQVSEAVCATAFALLAVRSAQGDLHVVHLDRFSVVTRGRS